MDNNVKELSLLVGDAHVIYIPQMFCKTYGGQIVNNDKLKEDIKICKKGPENEDYFEAWENIVDNAILTDLNGIKFTIGYEGDSGDLWGIPDGYIFDSED